MKLSPAERELADYLAQFAGNVVKAGGDKYLDAMRTLLVACGANEKLS